MWKALSQKGHTKIRVWGRSFSNPFGVLGCEGRADESRELTISAKRGLSLVKEN